MLQDEYPFMKPALAQLVNDVLMRLRKGVDTVFGPPVIRVGPTQKAMHRYKKKEIGVLDRRLSTSTKLKVKVSRYPNEQW